MTFITSVRATTTTRATAFLTAAAVTLMAVTTCLLTAPVGAANNNNNGNNVIAGGIRVPGKRLLKQTYCPGQVLSGDYRFMTTTVRSKLECVGQCQIHTDCMSVVYETDSGLCHLGNAMAFHNCSNMEPGGPSSDFYQVPQPCGVNEVLGPSGLCVCAPRFHGNPCERYTNDCKDLRLTGVWTDKNQGAYTVRPLNGPQEGVRVHCRLIRSTTARTTFMNRKHKEESFNRSYQEYRDGFGDADSDFWVGLQNLHLITSDRDYKMVVNMKVRTSPSNSNLVVYNSEYLNFEVTDEASGYKLLFDTSVVNSTDCLLPNHGVKFSARDHDRDGSASVNCADKRKGGFWYRGDSCSDCNPHGILYQPQSSFRLGTEDEVFWTGILGNKAVERIQMYLISVDP